jgi:hypothetical protein
MVLADSRRISRVLRYLGVQSGSQRAFVYGTFTLYGPTSQTVRLACWFMTPRPCGLLDPATPPHASVLGFGLIPVRSPLLGESIFLSFPGGTEMSHFPPLASTRLCIQRAMTGHDSRRVPPFGHPRVEACLQLSEAYRSLPRPSSPSRAKASTVRP